MDINKLFNTFVSELMGRKQEGFLSEDNIRFYWFASMLKQDQNLNHFSLEEPYGSNVSGNKELDLMYEGDDELWCFEIKFHRNYKKQTFAQPQSSGEMFDDIRRLPLWNKANSDKPIRYFFLYVTDDEMHQYLSNSTYRKGQYRPALAEFYGMPKGQKFDGTFVDASNGGDTPITFLKRAFQSTPPQQPKLHISDAVMVNRADVHCDSKSLKETKGEVNCHIRLYEILKK